MDAGNDPRLRRVTEEIEAASEEGVTLRLVGGLAVRRLCPDFPPRENDEQDVDLAALSRQRVALTRFLVDRGYVPDEAFNALHGHKQLFYWSPDGSWVIDLFLDRLDMCHVLDFRDRLEHHPHTLGSTDLLLSKLQVVELNRKDVHDIVYLLAAFPVAEGDPPEAIGLGRFAEVVSDDWGWWRTVTGNLERIADPAISGGLVPDDPPHDPLAQAARLREAAEAVPKSLRWRARALVGERVRWYELPEEERRGGPPPDP